jgi:hypothetical protein
LRAGGDGRCGGGFLLGHVIHGCLLVCGNELQRIYQLIYQKTVYFVPKFDIQFNLSVRQSKVKQNFEETVQFEFENEIS